MNALKAIIVYKSLRGNTAASARAVAGDMGAEGRGVILSQRPRYGGENRLGGRS